MPKEYPFFGMKPEQVIEETFMQSAKAISDRGQNYFVGFSIVQNDLNRNFTTQAVFRGERALKPLLKKLQKRLAKEKALAEKNESDISSIGWFIGEPRDIEKLIPRQTTFVTSLSH